LIEKRYDKYSVFSNKNTLEQFDQSETLNIPAANNRHIIDFSGAGNPASRNLGAPKRNTAIQFNRTELFFTIIDVKGNVTQNTNPSSIVFTDSDVSADGAYETPVFSEDMLVVFDQGTDDNPYGTYQRGGWVDTFRAGHLELTFKTSQENNIIGSGSTEVGARKLGALGAVFTPTPLSGFSINNESGLKQYSAPEVGVDSVQIAQHDNIYQTQELDKGWVNLEIGTQNGRLYLKYYDLYNKRNLLFELTGETYVSDNEWHHVVINFGRPGIKKYPGTKFNQKFIEFWVDSKIDKRFNNKIIQSEHIVYPQIEVLCGNLRDILIDSINNRNLEDSFIDVPQYLFNGRFDLPSDPSYIVEAMKQAENHNFFRGSIHTFLQSFNFPIDSKTISYRYNLWKNHKFVRADGLIASAGIVDPAVSTNKKTALKLFWNNLVEEGKYGLSLDENYQVESYSVTHRVANSPSELFNQEISKPKDTNILKNVKVALTENVLSYGPGALNFKNHNLARIGQGRPPFGTHAVHPKGSLTVASIDSVEFNTISHKDTLVGPIIDSSYSGVKLFKRDRILLTNQIFEWENGIWIFDELDKPLTRDPQDTIDLLNLGIVYVEEGLYADKYWLQVNEVSNINDFQKWVYYENKPGRYVGSKPLYLERWEDSSGQERFIDLFEDLDFSKYDLIVFMNYPETEKEVAESFVVDDPAVVSGKYNNFITSLIEAASSGANIFVSSAKLASDMGIVGTVEFISQEIEEGDARSAVANPFEVGEQPSEYFDTHRLNNYRLVTEVAGLTDRETYILTEFINYVPTDKNISEEWHAKYAYKQFGLVEGNEFIIPSLPLRKVQTQKDLPGQRSNARIEEIPFIPSSEVISGTIITKLSTNYYVEDMPIANPYSDNATTIIVRSGDFIKGKPVTGKIFVNLIEDSYTMSMNEYNQAVIQNVSPNDPGETSATFLWQYSTKRMNRSPKKTNIGELTEFGQTVATNSGGGGIVQSPTNSSIGEIRDRNERNNPNFQSELYYNEADEVYDLIEIPVLSMTMLGLKWLES